ncbi:hypothetical protein GCM10023084_05160 [Streptomyces lacrimifluminis]|uniref:Uncharacterized protein n=1 Tax=Streptomyces lacrimifluminis TaxID=1500077 RepID=A0A917NS07_9ACTN|nr:hypothetical protein GCM10012282_18900 [Streptomyces lacrimifluminis]
MIEAVARGGCLEADEKTQGPYRGRDRGAVAKATVSPGWFVSFQRQVAQQGLLSPTRQSSRAGMPVPGRVQGRVGRAVGGVGPALASWSRLWTSSRRAAGVFPRAETTAEEMRRPGGDGIRTWTTYSYRCVPGMCAVCLDS